ncbi:MAG: methyltransferase domain-containing protein [Pyrinomonadaceae bacterium]
MENSANGKIENSITPASMAGIGTHEIVLELIRKYFDKPVRMADLAAGEGAFSIKLKELGHEVVAIDASRDYWKAPEIDLKIQNLDSEFAEKILSNDNKFDAVIAIEIIEHLENPFRFARECAKLLKSGGLLFLTTPNVEAVYSRLIFLYTGRLNSFGEYETVRPAHITPIFKWKLDMLLSEAGFDIIEEDFNPQVFAEGTNLKIKISGFIAKILNPFVKGEKGGESRIIIARLK